MEKKDTRMDAEIRRMQEDMEGIKLFEQELARMQALLEESLAESTDDIEE